MGDRYTLYERKCPKCNEPQDEIYYAPSSGFLTHTCDNCKQLFEIVQDFSLRPITKEQSDQLYKENGFG